MPTTEKLRAAKSVVLPALIALMVLGSIYGGIASVTEAASMGAFGVLIAIVIRREFSFRVLQESVTQTLNTCGMIIWIGIGAAALVGVYNLMGGNHFVSQSIPGIDAAPIVIILLMMGILVVLGLFLDWIGIAMLTLPIFVPIIKQLNYDPIWHHRAASRPTPGSLCASITFVAGARQTVMAVPALAAGHQSIAGSRRTGPLGWPPRPAAM